MNQDQENLPEPLYPAAAARLLADALYRILEDDQGIICQGIDEDGKLKRSGVWRSKGDIKIIETKNHDIPLGSLFYMHKTEGDALTQAVFSNGVVMEL